LSTKPGELVDIDYLYDIGGESIFAPQTQDEEAEDPLAYLYSNLGDSGIVQDYDIEELIRYLAETRG
jgi:mono/diheme cytochrome c family protein